MDSRHRWSDCSLGLLLFVLSAELLRHSLPLPPFFLPRARPSAPADAPLSIAINKLSIALTDYPYASSVSIRIDKLSIRELCIHCIHLVDSRHRWSDCSLGLDYYFVLSVELLRHSLPSSAVIFFQELCLLLLCGCTVIHRTNRLSIALTKLSICELCIHRIDKLSIRELCIHLVDSRHRWSDCSLGLLLFVLSAELLRHSLPLPPLFFFQELGLLLLRMHRYPSHLTNYPSH